MLPRSVMAPLSCFLVSLFCVYEFMLRVLPSSMTGTLTLALHTSARGVSFINAAFFVSYALMQIPVGLLYDKFSARNLLAFAVGCCGTGTLLFGLSKHLMLAFIGRFLMGFGAAFAVPGTFLLVSRWFRPEYFAFITGLVQVMCAAGAIMGQAPIAALLKHHSWEGVTLGMSEVGFVFAIMYYFVIGYVPEEYLHTMDRPAINVRQCLARIGKKIQNWLIAGYALLTWAPITIFPALWGVPFLVMMYGITPSEASGMIAWAWVGVAVGSPVIGWVAYKLQCERLMLTLTPLLGSIVSFLILFDPYISHFVMCILLFLLGFSAGSLPLCFWYIKHHNPPYVTGTGFGFTNMSVVLGGAIFQPLVGSLLSVESQGGLVKEVPHYSLPHFQVALLVLPGSTLLCMLLGVLISRYL